MTARERWLMPARPAMVPTAKMSVANGPEPTPTSQQGKGGAGVRSTAVGSAGAPDPADYTQAEAWSRGVAAAEAELARQEPDDGTISVSLDRHGSGEDYPYFKLCLACHHERGSARCSH